MRQVERPRASHLPYAGPSIGLLSLAPVQLFVDRRFQRLGVPGGGPVRRAGVHPARNDILLRMRAAHVAAETAKAAVSPG